MIGLRITWDRVNGVHPRCTVKLFGITVAKQYWNALGNIWVSELPHYGLKRRIGVAIERIKVWWRSRK